MCSPPDFGCGHLLKAAIFLNPINQLYYSPIPSLVHRLRPLSALPCPACSLSTSWSSLPTPPKGRQTRRSSLTTAATCPGARRSWAPITRQRLGMWGGG